MKFDQKYQELLQSLANECERKRKALSDELAAELPYLALNNNTRTNIQMGTTTPWGKYATFVLPNLLMLVPGIGWGARIAIGVGSALFSFLFGDKQAKIREAKSKLRDALTPPSYEILNNMHKQVIETFNNEILGKAIDEFNDGLAGYQFMLARLGKSQYETLKIILGGDFDVDSYPLDFSDDTEHAFAVLTSNVSATNFKIAQQISGVPIIAR